MQYGLLHNIGLKYYWHRCYLECIFQVKRISGQSLIVSNKNTPLQIKSKHPK